VDFYLKFLAKILVTQGFELAGLGIECSQEIIAEVGIAAIEKSVLRTIFQTCKSKVSFLEILLLRQLPRSIVNYSALDRKSVV